MRLNVLQEMFARVSVPPGCCVDVRRNMDNGNAWYRFEVGYYFTDEVARCQLSPRQERAEEHRRLGQCEDFTDVWKSSNLCDGTPKPLGHSRVNPWYPVVEYDSEGES